MSARCVRASLVAAARPSPALAARWNSNQAGQADQKQQIRAAIKENDRLQSDWSENVLSYEQLLPKTESPTPDTFLIDVREPDETIQGMIPSAVNVPLSELSSAFALPAVTWKEKFNFEKPGRDQEVIFYCRSGKRSSSAADVAKRNGYTNIHNYKGSWLEWTEKQAAKPQD